MMLYECRFNVVRGLGKDIVTRRTLWGMVPVQHLLQSVSTPQLPFTVQSYRRPNTLDCKPTL